MKLLRNILHLPDFSKGTVVAPGNFDGIHLGHQVLLQILKQKSQILNIPLVVILFEPQPAEFFLQKQAPARLSSLRKKIQQLTDCGVDYVLCLKFNAKLAQNSAKDFAQRYFFVALHAKFLAVGQDFHFGYQREGNVLLLKQLAVKHDCEIIVADDLLHNNQRISSTKIRQALANGDLETALLLSGRGYSICGRVIRGDGRGRQWGIPTANIHLPRQNLPLNGVFCVKVQYNGNLLNGVANIGNRPTIDGLKIVLEIHLLNFDKSIYGAMLEVFFLHKLRDEIKFTSVEALISQIHNDILQTNDFFNVSAENHG